MNPDNQRNISEHQKAKHKILLEIEKSKDFGEEFVRTTDLERQIVDEYGFEGIKLIFEKQNSQNYFKLGNFPKNSHWSIFNSLNIPDFISKNFQSIKEKLPNFLEVINSRCRYIFVEKTNDKWKLNYFLDMKLYDKRNYFRIFKGGLPNTPEPNQNLKSYDWTIPKDLAEFYSIHDGFGELNGNFYLYGSDEIVVMAKLMNSICEKNNYDYPEDYNFEDLLEFFPDGAGNVQCFYRENGDCQNAQTVDWDHEVWEISGKSGFYEFIDDRMSQIDEE